MRTPRLSRLTPASVAAILAILAPRAGVAQSATDSAVTSLPRVRLLTPAIPERLLVIGELLAADQSTLTVRTGDREAVSVPRALVTQYSVSRGASSPTYSVVRAGVAGLLLGSIVGRVSTPQTAAGRQRRGRNTVTGALIGFGLGAAFGSLYHPERWEPAAPPAATGVR